MALIVEIAEAVVTQLNAASLSQTFTAQRNYLPIYELEHLKELRVTVVPKGIAISSAGRGSNQYDVEIDIAVQQKLTNTTAAEIDPLLALVEEITDLFRLRRLTAPDAVWVKSQNEPVYVQEHLDQFRVFTSVLTLTFRVIR